MNTYKKIAKKVNNFFYDHIILRAILHNFVGVVFAVVAAFIFAFGFTCFTTPASKEALDAVGMVPFTLVTGGVSGLTQNIALLLNTFGLNVSPSLVQSIGYFVINIPLLVFAFFKIGKRFAILTLVNVAASSLFIALLSSTGFAEEIASSKLIITNVLVRVLFAAVCTGVGSAIAFKGDISCGGIDIITYYFALRKSTTVGKYNILINAFIVGTYSIILLISDPAEFDVPIFSIIFSILYLFVCALVIDAIHVRNKKIQVEIITELQAMPEVLMANFPHGITVSKAKGAYSNKDKIMLWMVVSSNEVKNVAALARRADPHAFIVITPLAQVYGNFFIKPIQ